MKKFLIIALALSACSTKDRHEQTMQDAWLQGVKSLVGTSVLHAEPAMEEEFASGAQPCFSADGRVFRVHPTLVNPTVEQESPVLFKVISPTSAQYLHKAHNGVRPYTNLVFTISNGSLWMDVSGQNGRTNATHKMVR